jgi:SAM-dependent methyltransferase
MQALQRAALRVFGRSKINSTYSQEFFDGQQGGSRASADVIVPMIIAETGAKTVVDVGCGTGTWAAAFKENGCEVLGIDGDYVPRRSLQIPEKLFRPVDLNNPPPADEIGKFDLAVSLEVAEHLDPSNGPKFVDFLTSLAPTILFSAAIPGQGGKGHVNERWQSRWIADFAERGFAYRDIIRPRIWDDGRVKPWYAQNAFLLAKSGEAATSEMPLDVVHPRTFMRTHRHRKQLFSE